MKKSPKPATSPHRKRRYNAEFRAEAVRLLREREADGASSAEVARELGLNPSVLWQWAHAPEPMTSPRGDGGHGTGETLEQEVRRLRRENAILTQEREFAKKAAAFFARESP
jgi:transposase